MCPPSTSTPLDHPAPTPTSHPEGPASFGPYKIPKETKSVQRHRHTERKAKALHVQTLRSPALPPGLHVPMEKCAHRRPLRAAPALRIAYALVATNTRWGLTLVTRETPCRGVCARTRFRRRSASIVAAVSPLHHPRPAEPEPSSSALVVWPARQRSHRMAVQSFRVVPTASPLRIRRALRLISPVGRRQTHLHLWTLRQHTPAPNPAQLRLRAA
ncbi:hypothetical protein B0H14DRAFT_3861159 [Mycena olivaceomarginata]|nr:hypothetical protein B0H14DRAFT_3861159 [Mycena olivaceomarginata]